MKSAVRIAVVVALVAGMLVPGFVDPVRAITRPRTLAARHRFAPDSAAGTLRMDLSATHAMLSWSGDGGSGVRYRYLSDHGFTRWREAQESHDMERGRRHYSSPLLLDRSRVVQWAAFGGARQITLDYVNTLDGPRRRIIVPATAGAAASEPELVTREEWGADESLKRASGGCSRTFYDPQQLFVHHTVTSNHDPNPASTVRAIYHFHTKSRGWCDIGYNFLISGDGRIFEGRWARDYWPWEVHDGEDRLDRVTTGAHTAGFNSGSIGVSVLGNYQRTSLKRSARRALVSLLAWEMDRHNLNPRGRHRFRSPAGGGSRFLPYIAGHRDAGQTSCPGRYLYKALPSIRKSVARRVGRGKADSVLEGDKSTTITFGEAAGVRFRLTTRGGRPLADRPIAFHRRGRGPWVSAGRARTDADGWARVDLEPKRKLRVVAVWRGNERRWGSDGLVIQRVRPAVTIEPEGAVQTAPDTYELPEGTTEFFFGGTVAPKHVGREVIIRTWQRQSDDEYLRLPDRTRKLDGSSSYRARQSVPPEGGTYRLKAVIEPHGDHKRGRSRVIEVVTPAPLIPPIP